MRIAVDCDGVISDVVSHILPILNRKYGTNYVTSDVNRWDFPIAGYSIGLHLKSYFSDPSFILSVPEIEGAKAAIDQIWKNHEVIIVTGRPLYCKNNTLKWLIDRFKHDGVIFTVKKTVESTECDVLVDDYPGYGKDFIKSGGKCILFDQTWNQEENECVRAKNWPSALEILDSV